MFLSLSLVTSRAAALRILFPDACVIPGLDLPLFNLAFENLNHNLLILNSNLLILFNLKCITLREVCYDLLGIC
jgi:hypothetical protein